MSTQTGRAGALVTGASKGIGYAIARMLSARGHPVTIAARTREAVEDAARRIGSATGNPVRGVAADVADRAAATALVAEAIAFCGSLEVLVNNAGGSAFGSLLEITDEQWDDAFDVKLFGAVATMRAAIPHMIARGGGAIVNIAGTGGVQINPLHMAGGAANIALIHVTKAVAQQTGKHGIRVNAISPGPTATDRWQQAIAGMKSGADVEAYVQRATAEIPLGRIGEPEDIANMVAFLTSEQASYVTAQHFIVDGGRCRAL